ncbi:hypothetical protein ACFWDI_40785 [Streptomyces sp. NPDC060064]|uniref:hypothetical protein n=1 Tax=Streptomyces sp. NPDC060064 TaxID=3347049 RepID=UPI0036C36376
MTWQHAQTSTNPGPPTDFDIAITGGTGAYAKVRGYGHVTQTEATGIGAYTLYLIR